MSDIFYKVYTYYICHYNDGMSKHITFMFCIASDEINNQGHFTRSIVGMSPETFFLTLLTPNALKSQRILPSTLKLKQIRMVFLPRALHIQ